MLSTEKRHPLSGSPSSGTAKPGPNTADKKDTPAQQGKVERAAARRSARDRTIVAVMLYAGARVPECGRLDVEDIVLTARTGQIRLHGKGDQVRTVPLPAPARQALAAWSDERGTHDGPAWTGQRGRMTDSGITQVVLAVGDDAGIPGLRPHRLRPHLRHPDAPGRRRPRPRSKHYLDTPPSTPPAATSGPGPSSRQPS